MAAPQKTVADTFESLGQVITQTAKPVTDEVGKMLETAKAQVAGDTGTSEQGQAGASAQQPQIAQMQKKDDQASKAALSAQRSKLFSMVQARPPKPEETVAEKKEKEKKVEQFKLREKERKKLPPLSVQNAATAAERQRGASG